ncbi:unnamed protein product, partial [Linum tenue]
MYSQSSAIQALEESSISRDPLFLLKLAVCQQTNGRLQGDSTSYAASAWQRMVDVAKSFILHVQLKAFISNGKFIENPLPEESTASPPVEPAIFGSDISLGSGIPCRIAFSAVGVRHIFLIPSTKGTSGKLLLAEKHPFRSQRGKVIAIAPLAGLS